MPTASSSPRGIDIAVLAFDGISPFHLSVPCLVFGEDHTDDGVPRNALRICAERPGRLGTTAGFALEAPHGLDGLRGADLVIVPSWPDPATPASAALCDALRAAHADGATVVGLCLGAFPVAQAGLLDGRGATTHWRCADAFARRFPQVKLDPAVLYVEDGRVVTSAGTAAGLDCCLHLLRGQIGAELANRVARRIVVAPHRAGGQAQFIEQPVIARPDGDRLAAALAWARQNLNGELDVDALAARSLMSRRTFTRQFRERTGTTFSQWLVQQRVALSQRLLETTDFAVERIAAEAGFGSAISLRQHFARQLRITPAAYRRSFRGPADG
ncbi:MAG TPA: helix-turn-helix domain-containing protein [Telluria sp.]|nr:helix-turn-helix domain-containing protein [Telluria sp.]